MPSKIYDTEELDNVTFRIEKSTLYKVDEYWRTNLLRDRSDLIRRSLEFIISSKRCPHCGAINPRGGHICSVCLRPLNENDELSDLLWFLKQNPQLIDEFKTKK